MLGTGLILKRTKLKFFQNGKRLCSVPPPSFEKCGAETMTPLRSLPAFSKDDNVEFMTHFPIIVNDITTNGDYQSIPDYTDRLAKMLYYNLPNGKKVRGLTTLISYKMLEKPENLTKENLKLANTLGWCMEMLESSILIIDDIIDRSQTRRNLPCWYKKPDVGNLAILDAAILEKNVQFLLKKYFSSHPFYVPILELFSDTYSTVSIGQMLDCKKYELSQINMETYLTITKYKTGYTFICPVILGMYLSKVYNEELLRQATPILMEMVNFFQIKNDFNDCFGETSVTGKEGTDIQEGKCTWMSTLALEKANSTQYQIMVDHFGKPDRASVETVLKMYRELQLEKELERYEEQSFKRICDSIKELSDTSIANLLYNLVEKSYKRQRI